MNSSVSAPSQQLPAHKWLRTQKSLPHLWCPGCGLGTILNTMTRVLEKLAYHRNDLVLVSGIGCTGRMPVYMDCNTLHTTHGRALTFATGVKLARPKLKVLVVTGDGDALAIGGNHFIHAARRNIDITTIVVNNFIYGMTGGQCSPTTPQGKTATTARAGNVEQPFDVCRLAMAAGATYVARSTVFHIKLMEKLMTEALLHTGFSVFEVMANCHTNYGRLNEFRGPLPMLHHMKDRSVRIKPGENPYQDLPEDKDFLIGVLKQDTDTPEFCQRYHTEVVAPARAAETKKSHEKKE